MAKALSLIGSSLEEYSFFLRMSSSELASVMRDFNLILSKGSFGI